MAGNDLIIDDTYCNKMIEYIDSQGEKSEQIIERYIQILQSIRNEAIVSGDVANALSAYINYANKLRNQIGIASASAKTQIGAFLSKVDSADKISF